MELPLTTYATPRTEHDPLFCPYQYQPSRPEDVKRWQDICNTHRYEQWSARRVRMLQGNS